MKELKKKEEKYISMTPFEEEICSVFKNFEENYWEKKSQQVEAYSIRDILVIRSQGSLSPAEEQLVKNEEGKILLKELKIKELSSIKNILKFLLENKLNIQILSLVIDNTPELDETIIVCRLNRIL